MNIHRNARILESIYLPFRDQSFRLVFPKYFWKTDPNKPVELTTKIISEIKTTLEEYRKGKWALHCNYRGKIRTTRFFLRNKVFNPKIPTLVFHLGSGHNQYSTQTMLLFGRKFVNKFNLFFIEPQNHCNRLDLLFNCADSFENMQLTFAGSVLAIEEIVNQFRAKTNLPIIVSGLSSGGTIITFHAYIFGTADKYFPIVAFPNFTEQIFNKHHKHLIHKRKSRMKNESYTESFEIDMDELLRKAGKKIFPILGIHDKISEFKPSYEFWKEFDPLLIDSGHFSVITHGKEIRDHILSKSGLSI